jgi:hypothetical protein
MAEIIFKNSCCKVFNIVVVLHQLLRVFTFRRFEFDVLFFLALTKQNITLHGQT